MHATNYPYSRRDGMTLSESIDSDHALLRTAIEDKKIFALLAPNGRLVYVEMDGAPAELIADALPVELVAQHQEAAKLAHIRKLN